MPLAVADTDAALIFACGIMASLTVTWSILRPSHISTLLHELTVPTSLSLGRRHMTHIMSDRWTAWQHHSPDFHLNGGHSRSPMQVTGSGHQVWVGVLSRWVSWLKMRRPAICLHIHLWACFLLSGLVLWYLCFLWAVGSCVSDSVAVYLLSLFVCVYLSGIF